MSQGDDGERKSAENESTPPTSRRETRSTQGSPSPLTPLEFQPPKYRDREPSTSKKPSSKVTLNHPTSNIIGDLDEGLCLRKGLGYCVNHVSHTTIILLNLNPIKWKKL